MELTAKLIQVLPAETGNGKNGRWKKQSIILEQGGQYPKKVCVTVWGEKINIDALQLNKDTNVSFDVESREFNGRWFTDIKAWKVTQGAAASSAPSYSQPPLNDAPFPSEEPSGQDEEIPF